MWLGGGMEIERFVVEATGADAALRGERVQALWSGYGEIVRYHLSGWKPESAIVKHVSPPDGGRHPRGWNTDLSHLRKLRSYEVEMVFYERYARRCGSGCRVAELLGSRRTDNGWMMVLEDLDASGFTGRNPSPIRDQEIEACLGWLAHFHAAFLGEAPDGLWEAGTYWHLATRPDELAAMEEGPLKRAAEIIDTRLSGARFQTFVHGDAKLANFCFRESAAVAAVDFQYVGRGCGMKDLAYFLGSCLSDEEREKRERELLDVYFEKFSAVMGELGTEANPAEIEAEWRGLYPFAWADFHRFLAGWSPGHWKINRYSARLVREVVEALN